MNAAARAESCRERLPRATPLLTLRGAKAGAQHDGQATAVGRADVRLLVASGLDQRGPAKHDVPSIERMSTA